jgi:alpha-glucosidase
MILMALRGTPVMYYGDEFGMPNTWVMPWRLKDPVGRRAWPVYAGRDRARTPMQWEDEIGAGFTRPQTRPWLPYGDLRLRSVESQQRLEDSTLGFTRALMEFRAGSKDLQLGEYEPLEVVPSVWAWRRGRKTVVVLNMSNFHQELKSLSGTIKLATRRHREGEKIGELLHLTPWEGAVIEE